MDKSSTDKCEESAADSNKENKEMPVGDNASNATLSAMKVENPPSPTSVPVPQPSLTSEDTLKLHNTNDRKDDDISLIVHVDDTQNDLDNDLLGTPLKKPAAGEKDDNTDKAGAKDSVGDVTADPAAKAEDGAAGDDKKPAAAGSTSPKKTSTADPKKGTAAEGKKTEVKKEEAGKKTPEKKEAEKKDGDKTKRLVGIAPYDRAPQTVKGTLMLGGRAALPAAFPSPVSVAEVGFVSGAVCLLIWRAGG